MAIDWLAIRNEYVTLGKSITELAQAHGLKRTTVGARCVREGWEDLRKQFANTVRTNVYKETSLSMASTEADRLTRLLERGDRLGRLCEQWMDRAEERGAKPQDIKAMADALMRLSELGRVAEPDSRELRIIFGDKDLKDYGG